MFRTHSMEKFVAQAGTVKPSAARAAEILKEIFAPMEDGFRIRLWDGSEVDVGKKIRGFTVHFLSLRVFKRLIYRPTTFNFAEAYIERELDFEGDLFETMEVANSMEYIDLSLWKRLVFGWQIWRLSE